MGWKFGETCWDSRNEKFQGVQFEPFVQLFMSCKTKVLKVNQEEAFAGKSYERRHEEGEGELVQVAGNKASKTFRSDSN